MRHLVEARVQSRAGAVWELEEVHEQERESICTLNLDFSHCWCELPNQMVI